MFQLHTKFTKFSKFSVIINITRLKTQYRIAIIVRAVTSFKLPLCRILPTSIVWMSVLSTDGMMNQSDLRPGRIWIW